MTVRHMMSMKFLETSSNGKVTFDKVETLISDEIDKGSTVSSLQSPEKSFITCRINITNHVQKIVSAGNEENNEEQLSEIQHACDQVPLTIKKSDFSSLNKYEQSAVAYFAGYISHLTVSQTKCETCLESTMKSSMDDIEEHETYTRFKEFQHFDEDRPEVSSLKRSTNYFVEVVYMQLQNFHFNHEKFWPNRKLLETLVATGVCITNKKFPDYFNEDEPCFMHKLQAIIFLYQVKVHATCRQHNNARITFSRRSMTKNNKYNIVNSV